MSEDKTKKIRIANLAGKINVSADMLLSYLKEKRYNVKSPNSVVTEEMLKEIEVYFQKDIERSIEHKKKWDELKNRYFSKAEVQEFSQSKEEIFTNVQTVEGKDVDIETIEINKQNQISDENLLTSEYAGKEISPKESTIDTISSDISADKAKNDQKTKEKPTTTEFIQPKDKVNKNEGLKIIGILTEDEKDDKSQRKKKSIPVETKAEPKEELKKEKKKFEPQPPQENNIYTPVEKDIVADIETKTEVEEDKPKSKDLKLRKKKKIEEIKEETYKNVKKKKHIKYEIDEKEVLRQIKNTVVAMESVGDSAKISFKKKKKKEREAEQLKREQLKLAEQNKIKVTEFVSANDLANLMRIPVTELIAKSMSLGQMVSINQRLDSDLIILLASEFGFDVEFADEFTSEILDDFIDSEDDLLPRPPIVTIMGHVDHGKTTLLDFIRNTNVVAGEAGGITQHIGAYKVDLGDGKSITFLDTPGHEAFTAMRARGAQLTDIVVLVVAADDAVMPQTVEAINHAQAANVPIIVAINKIDKPGVHLDKIRQQLADKNLLVEQWGGKYQCVEISAKTGKNINLLLEKILLEAEILELKANPNRPARGVVVEAKLDKGRGTVATILVQKGTLEVGNICIAGICYGRVRSLFDERGNKVDKATPATPVQMLGFDATPQAGDSFVVVDSEKVAREITIKRLQFKREQDHRQSRHLTLDEVAKQIAIGGVKELPLIIKGDVDGSVEALSDALMKLSNQEVIVKVIHRGVGGITESDVLLAAASNAIIIGFNVRPNIQARKLADEQKVDIRIYSIIYDVINQLKSALEGLLSPIISEEITATLEVREIFKVPKVGTVAGCMVLDGKIARNNKIRLVRNGVVIHQGDILSLKRFKDDVREVEKGYECGISLVNYNDIKQYDIIEAFKLVETKKTLN